MNKPRIFKTDVQTVIIPSASREYFLTQPSPGIHCMDDYKVLLAGISKLTPGYLVERTPSYFNLILYCNRGSATVRQNNRSVKINPGEILIAPAGTTYSYQPTGRNWDISWAHLIDGPEWNVLFGSSLLIRQAQWGKQVVKTMESYIDEANTRHPDSKKALKLNIELLVVYLKRELSVIAPDVISAQETLQVLWSKVHENLQHKWTIDEMAASTGLCRTQLYRLCLKVHETTPMDMVTTMRMELASEMLSFTNYTLTMIADGTGYENAFAFSKAFKRYSGISPKEYRAKKTAVSPET